MRQFAKPIAAIHGASSRDVQALLQEFVANVRPMVRVAGVVEEGLGRGGGASAGRQLRSLGDGRRYPIFQDLGPSSTACNVDAAGIVTACDSVCRDIAAGCDLVVLNKFGKLEAERSGLTAAFVAGIESRRPILTSVAPKFDQHWAAFAAPLFVVLAPDKAAVEGWWRGVAPERLLEPRA